ncbi:hypothetical protein Leryth_003383 [Lithospermum erythrorhizon]|nr:hypothetical protein Leryth_003383 [Lithospermum erythrorhizon]
MSAQMINHSRREKWMQTSSLHNNNNKRKEIDSIFNVSKPLPLTTKKLAKPSQHHKHPPPLSPAESLNRFHNHLLAGYLAHEFLSKGTLFGQTWDPARAEAIPVGGSSRVKQKQKRKIIEVDDKYVRNELLFACFLYVSMAFKREYNILISCNIIVVKDYTPMYIITLQRPVDICCDNPWPAHQNKVVQTSYRCVIPDSSKSLVNSFSAEYKRK